ncbi:hypothetical protein HX794_04640 [Pseudomonas costantinii]|uniref:Uncharacterized protein n=1 Tax=Pseudomonas costantinii TaxID=168469 RepID=A0A1S2ULN9_9PSED|nr:hypothetical protein [Pseudomonas costantinii]OIN47351.1 hypothetical protein BFL40_25760 [Pseudomonas costantinii]SEE45636.1 hypothetical protein SAMN04515675_5648 [Pseudomonas costantinii]
MRIFSLMFKSNTRYRHFASVDANGVCIAFKTCHEKPANGHWVEVEHLNLCWLGNALPSHARIV